MYIAIDVSHPVLKGVVALPFVYGRGSARNELCNVDWTIVSNMGVVHTTSNTKSEARASPFKSNFFKFPYLKFKSKYKCLCTVGLINAQFNIVRLDIFVKCALHFLNFPFTPLGCQSEYPKDKPFLLMHSRHVKNLHNSKIIIEIAF